MEKFRILRLLQGRSQFELGLATQIPSYRLSVLENGKVAPKEGELEKLAAALETTPEVLKRPVSEEALISA